VPVFVDVHARSRGAALNRNLSVDLANLARI
jgi:hypothetical protein